MIVYELKPGETFTVGSTVVRLEHKSGQRARLSIDAPANIEVRRSPVTDAPTPHMVGLRPKPT